MNFERVKLLDLFLVKSRLADVTACLSNSDLNGSPEALDIDFSWAFMFFFFFCSAVLTVMAFYPHGLWSHDFSKTATVPKRTSLLKVVKSGGRTAPAMSVSLEVPQQTSSGISLVVIVSCGHR